MNRSFLLANLTLIILTIPIRHPNPQPHTRLVAALLLQRRLPRSLEEIFIVLRVRITRRGRRWGLLFSQALLWTAAAISLVFVRLVVVRYFASPRRDRLLSRASE